MTESINGNEQGQMEEYWTGHSLEDACIWKEWEDTPNAAARTGTTEARNFALEALASERTILQGPSLKTLREGDVFEASKYPPGTIIRMLKEAMQEGTTLARQEYWVRLYYGVVYPRDEFPEGRSLVTVAAEELNDKIPWVYPYPTPISIGQTQHDKVVWGGLAGRWGRNRLNNIQRVKSIDILKFGRGVPIKGKVVKAQGKEFQLDSPIDKA